VGEPAVIFDGVWKKFRRGERHDSLRDLIPALARRVFLGRRRQELEEEEFWALRDVSFEVKRGEALGIIGPNGAGKSTALKLLTRILKPTRGRCEVRGRTGALIEVAAGFHPDLTGRENVYLQGAILGMKRADIARKFDAIVEFAGIGEFIDTPVKHYSSGMNARLGFAIAAHLDPEVLVIDEVLAVGDMSFQQKCYERLGEFRRAGLAIVFVSHNMQAVASICERALLLRPKRAPVLGATSAVVAEYAASLPSSLDERIEVVHAQLCKDEEEAPLRHGIKPGTWLCLRADLRARVLLDRCAIALIVRRADGTVVFDGSSLLDGVPPVDIAPGELLRATIRFRANLLRGTYSVAVGIFHETRRWPSIAVPNVASFSVAETTRAGGYAELEPRYELCAELPCA
jgi:lipopolysaccharide transport system ATP-binding protein